jgi:hypothetical protein
MSWQPISTAPKVAADHKGDVPEEYVLDFYDPDNTIECRLQVGMWNNRWQGWQSLMDNMTLMRPTHWRPRPKPPLDCDSRGDDDTEEP